MYKGWIAGALEDAKILSDFGIKLGEYNHAECEWINCEVTTEQLIQLEPLWMNYFIWGLEYQEA